MAFTRFTKNVLNVSALPDRVQNQAQTLKATFDQAGVDIKAALNALIVELEASTSADNIGADVQSVATKTVQAILNAFEEAIANRYTKTESETLVSEETNDLVADIDVNLGNGVITVTKKDGTQITFDTAIEKVPSKFEIIESGNTYYLRITNLDGTTTQADVTSLMNIYHFNNSNTITFEVAGEGNQKTVTANVRDNSIGLGKLELNVVSTLEGYMASAKDSATAAKTSETNARTSELNALEAKNSALNSAASANTSAQTAQQAKQEITTIANTAKSELNATAAQAKADTNSNALLAKSYAVGGTGSRAGEDVDNAKYYSEQAKATVTGDYVTRPEFQEGIKDFATEAYVDEAVANAGGGITEIPIATVDTLGGIKVGEGLEITEDGILSALGGGTGGGSGYSEVDLISEPVEYNMGTSSTTIGQDLTLNDSITNYNEIVFVVDVYHSNNKAYYGRTNIPMLVSEITYNDSESTGVDGNSIYLNIVYGIGLNSTYQLGALNAFTAGAHFRSETKLRVRNTTCTITGYTKFRIFAVKGIKYNIKVLDGTVDVDDTPTAGSDNVVTSGGVKTYVDTQVATKVDATYVNNAVSSKVDATYVTNAISGKADTSYVNSQISSVNTALAGKADTSHTQAASTITAGTLAGQVNANASAVANVGTAQVRNITASTTDLTAGTSALATGDIYFVYE